MNILDGRKASKHLINKIKLEVTNNKITPPKMGIILVGNNPASETYVKAKIKACKESGFLEELIKFDNDVLEQDLISKIIEINNDNTFNNLE